MSTFRGNVKEECSSATAGMRLTHYKVSLHYYNIEREDASDSNLYANSKTE